MVYEAGKLPRAARALFVLRGTPGITSERVQVVFEFSHAPRERTCVGVTAFPRPMYFVRECSESPAATIVERGRGHKTRQGKV